MNTQNKCNWILLFAILLLSSFGANAQLTQLLDDFNRSNSAVVGTPVLGPPAWTEVETGTTTTLGCNLKHDNDDFFLRLSSTSTSSREYVWRDCSSNYNTVLSSNPSQLLWQFKMRQTRTDPSGFANNAWGMAVILGSSSSAFHNAGTGYAVVLGTPSTTTDPIRLVKFTGGFSVDANLTNLISSSDYSDDFLAVKVYYTPATNLWQMYVDNEVEDNNDFTDVNYNSATLRGTAVDGSYTSQDLKFVGALFNHANSTGDNARLDEIYLPLIITPAHYFSKSTGNLNNVNTWGKNTDGSGPSPSNFTTAGQVFHIRNNLSPTINGLWTVSGTQANVLLGDSASNIVFTIPETWAFRGPVDVSPFSKLIIQNDTVPTINQVGIPSIVEYASALTQTIRPVYYWDLICTSTGGRTWSSGTTGILDTFSVGANAFNPGTGTIDFAGAQPQYLPDIRYPGIINTGGGDRVLSPTGIIEIAGIMTPSIGIYTITGSTVNYSLDDPHTIPVLYVGGVGPNYNNLILSGDDDHVQEGHMIVGGNLTVTDGDYYQNTGSTIFTLAVYGNLTISGGDFWFADGTGANVLTLKGNLVQTSGRTRVSGTNVIGKITFAGTGIQTIAAADSTRYETCVFTVASGAHVKLLQHLTLQRSAAIPLSLKGTMNVLSGGTLECNTFRISSGIGSTGNSIFNLNSGATLITANPNGVYGPGGSVSSLNIDSTFNSAANYVFNSGSPQVPGLSNSTMNNLTIDNTANVTLQSNLNVNGLISFLNGKFNTTNSFKISLGSNGSVTGAGAGKYVNGTFEKFILTGTTAKSFEIGEATSYNPVLLVFPPASNSTGSIIARVFTGDHALILGSGIDSTKSVNRRWNLVNNGVTGIIPYNAEFTFVNPDNIDAGSNPLAYVVRNYSNSTWTALGAGIATTTKTGATGINEFNDFQVGQRYPPPTVTCPVVASVNATSGCSAIVNFAATFTGVPVPTITYSQNPGTLFPVGTTQVTVTVSNINATVTCTIDVTVSDVTNPVINNCPTEVITFADFGICEAVVSWTEPTASDNCSATISSDYASGSAFHVGTTTVTYTATDPSGNTATCSFDITVYDGESPVLTPCPADITMDSDGDCGRIVTWDAPTATDNCTYTLTSNYNSGDFFPVGANTITYTATDSSGNVTSCSFTITINDTQLPVITCPSDISKNTDSGVCGALVTFTVGATDNCVVDVVTTHPSGSLFTVGTTVVSSTATDASGNTASCTFNVIVTDNENPVVTCPADTIVPTEPNACGAVVNFSVGYTDNCLVNLVSTPASGSFFPVGTTNVVSVATDSTGNTATCSFNVTVVNATSFDTSSCDIYYFPWGGTTVISGDFSFTYTAAGGCDSIVTAHVTINHVDDQSECTIDACNTLDGSVSHTPVNVDDGNACTTDGCDSVTGTYHNTNGIVDDNNVCTLDGCDTSVGPIHTIISVDDNNVCTIDACDPVTGPSHTLFSINDNDSCTVDACDPVTGVSHNPVDRDDNNMCTIDGCDPDFGVFYIPSDPDDGNPCTLDGCDSSTGSFTHTSVDTDDSDLCTVDGCDSTSGGIYHNPVDRDDEDACTIDICDPFLGVFNIPMTSDDNDACTEDGCNTLSGIYNNPINTEDNNVCTIDGCDPVSGPYHNPVNIDDNDVCTTDGCDSVTGPFHTPVNTDDGNSCTIDECNSITGVSHTPVDINDNDVCTDDACDSVTGVSHTPVDRNDNDECTLDICDPDLGVFHIPVSTDDGNPCTLDGCDSVTGISHTPVNTDDGDACTTDACNSSTGIITHTAVNVDDNDPCTADGCDSSTGIYHTPICNVTLNSNIFLEGFYSGSGLMQHAGTGYLHVTGISSNPLDVDTIEIYVLNSTSPYSEVDHQKGILKVNGNVSVTFSSSVVAGNSYFIKVKHKNCIETWSALPVLFANPTNYFFSTSASQAYNLNMIETPDQQGWALYSGDLDQNGSIDGTDFLIMEPGISNGDGGYLVTDVNGDGQVDGSDFLVIELNIFNGVGISIP